MKKQLLLITLITWLCSMVTKQSRAQIFWTEDFQNSCSSGCFANTYTGSNGTWTTTSTGTNEVEANAWFVSGSECGNAASACGTVCGATDPSLHVGTNSGGNVDPGAAYDVGGIYAVITNMRAESPVINCVGLSNIILSFNYIENGQATTDDATLWYFNGTTWAQIHALTKTTLGGCSPQGTWTAFSITLPASADNNPNVKIGFNWTNNNDGVGTDPSFAVDDITLFQCNIVVNAGVNQNTCSNDNTVSLSGTSSTGSALWSSLGTGTFGNSSALATNYTLSPADIANGSVSLILTSTANGGCNAGTDTLTVSVNPLPSVNFSNSTVLCAGQDIVFTNLTTGAISYSWDFGDGNTSVLTNPQHTYSTNGLYNVTLSATSAAGCYSYFSNVVNEPVPMIISFGTTNTSCGLSDGVITATALNGSVPYNYSWSNGDKIATADSLAPGQYKVEVVDNNGCKTMALENVIATNGPVISLNSLNNVSCYAGNDGSIDITVTGGTAPLSVLWSTGSNQLNITGLSSNVYDVSVVDSVGCAANATYVISEPDQLFITPVISSASCGVNDGSISTTSSGGTPPYTYLWSANAFSATTANVSSLSSGFYSITVTDANSCVSTHDFAITNTSPEMGIVVDTILATGCTNVSGVINISVSGNYPPFNYQWSNGVNSEDMINALPGLYSVMITDTNNCSMAGSYNIPNQMAEYVPQICLVTVNDTSNLNRVIWEKQDDLGIKQYNIYRETSVYNSYLKVGTVLFNELSVFQDTVANTNTHSWRYKISAVDSCGYETDKSSFKKTIHRVLIPNSITGNVRLEWDYYDGAAVNKYYIYRELGFDWELIDSVPNTVLSYTDIAPPAITLDYLIEADLNQICNPTMRLNGNNSTMAAIVKSRSNIKTNRVMNPNGIKAETKPGSLVKIYPNPVMDWLSLEIPGLKQEASIEIVNILGQLVYTDKTKQVKSSLDASSFQNGVYIVRVNTGNNISSVRLVIQR